MTRLLAFFTVLALTEPALAHREPPPPRGDVDVSLICEGSRCDEVSHRGQRYVVAEYGERYAIALSNRSGGWVEVVVSVDGRSVTDGRRIGSSSRGYLIAPYDRVEIEGWRIDMDDVAAFRFTSVGDSYAGRTGDASQAGVIRVDVYAERARPQWVPPPEPVWRNEEDRPAPKAGAAESSSRWRGDDYDRGQNLGTQYGESRTQRVELRDFDRGVRMQSLTLRYDDRRGLASRGILHREWEDRDTRWVPPPPPIRIDD